MNSGWYLRQGSVQTGPFSVDELLFLVRQGRLKPTDQLRCVDQSSWISAADLGELFAPAQHAVPSSTASLPPHPRVTRDNDAPDDQPIRTNVFPPTNRPAEFKPALVLASFIALAALILIAVIVVVWNRPQSEKEKVVDSTVPSSVPSNAEPHSESTTAKSDAEPGRTEQVIGTPKVDSDSAMPKFPTQDASDNKPRLAGNGGNASRDPSSDSDLNLATVNVVRDSPKSDSKPATVTGALLPPGAPQARTGVPSIYGGRRLEERAKLAESDGGTPESEAAVELALNWLATHQFNDGHWSLDQFSRANDCNGQCSHPGITSDIAATALALLPFLGAGETPDRGKHQTTVTRAIDWLRNAQHAQDRQVRGFPGARATLMYEHGLATLAMCEAYAMTGDKETKRVAQRAVDFIVEAQDLKGGGWRYAPKQPGDLSVTGWQIIALRSAQLADLEVPKQTMIMAREFLASVQASPEGDKYEYLPGFGAGQKTMTAVGLLSRQFMDWNASHPAMLRGGDYLVGNLPNRISGDFYYWYYATQVMHNLGGDHWEQWNVAMRDLLVNTQEQHGHAAGSWPPMAGHDHSGGRLYATALAACILEVYYRHLPLYRMGSVK